MTQITIRSIVEQLQSKRRQYAIDEAVRRVCGDSMSYNRQMADDFDRGVDIEAMYSFTLFLVRHEFGKLMAGA